MPPSLDRYMVSITRVHDGDTPPEPMNLPDDAMPIFTSFDNRGTAQWEAAEQVLVHYHRAAQWPDATYRIDVSVKVYNGDPKTLVAVTRNLPLDPAYARLSYNGGNDGLPVRAYIVNLTGLYPGTTLEQVARFHEAFDDHYRARIGTPTLVELTGWTPPAGWRRPLSHYADGVAGIDELPEHLL